MNFCNDIKGAYYTSMIPDASTAMMSSCVDELTNGDSCFILLALVDRLSYDFHESLSYHFQGKIILNIVTSITP